MQAINVLNNSSDEDIRLQIANNIFNNCNDGEVCKVLKTTRAGATTSLCLAALKRGEKFLVLEPTNQIIKNTILMDVYNLSKKEDAKIIHVPSNFDCLVIQSMIDKNKNLAELPFILLPNKCAECDLYNECSVPYFLTVDEFDGVVMTYHKLVALMKSAIHGSELAIEILEKLHDVDVVIFDEAHELMVDNTSKLDVNKHNIDFINQMIKALRELNGDSSHIQRVLLNYASILAARDVSETIEGMASYTEDSTQHREWWHQHQATDVVNSKRNIAFINPNKSKKNKSNRDEINPVTVIFKEIVELIQKNKDISEEQVENICKIYDIINLIMSDDLIVHAQKSYENGSRNCSINTDLCAIDTLYRIMISDFTKRVQVDRKTILTSATFCSYDYKQMFEPETEIKNVFFGEHGDSLGNNSKLTIFCDSKSYSSFGKYSTYNCRNEIRLKCQQIIEIHGDENCIIFCRNKKEAGELRKYFREKIFKDNSFKNVKYKPQITYYKSSAAMGVKSSKRVAILIGLAHKPSHAYDAIRKSPEDSRILAEECMHMDTWQAASRVKDPNGIEPSVIFALGCNKRDVENFVSWGSDRDVEIIYPEVSGKSKTVNVHIQGGDISKPNVVLTNNWQEIRISSILYKNYLYSEPKILPYYKSNGRFEKNEFKINSKCSLLDDFFGDRNVSTKVKRANRTFSDKSKPLTDEIVSKHLNGERNYYFYALTSDNNVNFIMLETESEYNISKLKLFFDSNEYPYVIEKIDSSYRTWVFLKEVDAKRAKSFGEDILKKVGFKLKGKNKEVELYPKQTIMNTHSPGDLIKMPFGRDSKILTNAEFVGDFSILSVGTLDIDLKMKLSTKVM